MSEELNRILDAARAHALSCNRDVALASTRAEQIRLSVRAAEANRMVEDLKNLVYTYGETVAYFSMHPAEG